MRHSRACFILAGIPAVLFIACVYLYLAWLQPSKLAPMASDLLRERLGCECTVESMTFSLSPFPAITASGLALSLGKGPEATLRTQRAEAEISWLSLITMKPVFRSLRLSRPELELRMPPMDPFSENGASTEASAIGHRGPVLRIPSLPPPMYGLSLRMDNGRVKILHSDGSPLLEAEDLDAEARLPGILPGHLDFSAGTVRIHPSEGIDVEATETRLKLSSLHKNLHGKWTCEADVGTSLQMQSLDKAMGRTISAPYRYFPMPRPMKIACRSTLSVDKARGDAVARGRAGVTAVLPMNGHEVPISLDVPFEVTSLSQPVLLNNAEVRMEDDSAAISGRLCGLADLDPVLEGTAEIHHFSLTRWFGFARLMDPGLQESLDAITGTFHEFRLSARGVSVPRLTARVRGIQLKGSGGCEKFLSPVVRIDAHAARVNLHSVFPELSGKIPDMSMLPPPVLPLSDSSPRAAGRKKSGDDTPVGYDIHISADKADALGMTFGGADVHVVPAPGSGTMLPVEVANAYGGRASAKVYIRDRIRITARLSQVGLDGPASALAGFKALTGTLARGDADVSFLPGNGARMLTSLGGSLKADITDGSLALKNSPELRFTSFNLQAAAVPAAAPSNSMPSTFPLSGSWKASMDTGKWKADIVSDKAVLGFGSRTGLPALIKDQPFSARIRMAEGCLPGQIAQTSFSISSAFSMDTGKNTLGFRKTTVSGDRFTISGSGGISSASSAPKFTGDLLFTTKSLRNMLALFGLRPPQGSETCFENASLAGHVQADQKKLEFSSLSLSVDKNKFHGSFALDMARGGSWTARLHSPSLELDRYIPKTEGPEHASRTTTPLPLDLLKTNSFSLEASADRMRALKTTFSKPRLVCGLDKGVLSAKLSGFFPSGGAADTNFTASLSDDGRFADVSLSCRTSFADLGAIGRDRGQHNIITGRGGTSAKLHTRQQNWEDWKKTLDGSLSFHASDGMVTTADASPSSGTTFKAMTFTAEAQKGVVTSKDFSMTDSFTKVAGTGSLDLRDMSISANASITVAGIPELPMTIRGTLFKPETNYKLLGAVTGTVGNIGASLFDLAGGIIGLPFKIFSGTRKLSPSSESH